MEHMLTLFLNLIGRQWNNDQKRRWVVHVSHGQKSDRNVQIQYYQLLAFESVESIVQGIESVFHYGILHADCQSYLHFSWGGSASLSFNRSYVRFYIERSL